MEWALTSLQRYWLGDDPQLLGPWCVSGEPTPDQLDRLMPNPVSEENELHRRRRAVSAQYDSTISVLGRALNTIHDVDYPEKYWEIFLGPWLWGFLHCLSRAVSFIDKALQKDSDFRAAGPEAGWFYPRNFRELNLASITDFFNQQLFAQILELKGADILWLGSDRGHFSVPFNQGNSSTLIRWIAEVIFPRISKIKGNYVCLIGRLSTEPAELAKLSVRSRFNIIPRHNPRLDERSGGGRASAVRGFIRDSLQGVELLDPIDRELLSEYLPTVYLEGYSGLKQNARSFFATYPSSIVGGSSWATNELMRLIAAEAKIEGGTTLVGWQHGGGYGEAAYHELEVIERKITDHYITWGWEETGSKAGVRGMAEPSPLSVPGFAESSDATEEGEILLIGYEFRRLGLWMRKSRHHRAKSYWARLRSFLDALSSDTLRHVRYRPFPRSDKEIHYTDENRKRVLGAVVKGNQGALRADLERSKLVVLASRRTVYLEALARNVPTILTWSDEWNPPREAARSALEELKDVDILWEDPCKAAKKVEEIREDPEEWWNQDHRQRARANFVHERARVSDDWQAEWISFLEENCL